MVTIEETTQEVPESPPKMSLKDIYVLFFVLVKQNQKVHPGSKMSFDLNIFKTLPKDMKITFERKDGRLFAYVPEKAQRKKRRLLLPPDKKIIT
jgi:hypothetical protein